MPIAHAIGGCANGRAPIAAEIAVPIQTANLDRVASEQEDVAADADEHAAQVDDDQPDEVDTHDKQSSETEAETVSSDTTEEEFDPVQQFPRLSAYPQPQYAQTRHTMNVLLFLKNVYNSSYETETVTLRTIKHRYTFLREVREAAFVHLHWLEGSTEQKKKWLEQVAKYVRQFDKWHHSTHKHDAKQTCSSMLRLQQLIGQRDEITQLLLGYDHARAVYRDVGDKAAREVKQLKTTFKQSRSETLSIASSISRVSVAIHDYASKHPDFQSSQLPNILQPIQNTNQQVPTTSASQVPTSESALPTPVNVALLATNPLPTSEANVVAAKSPKPVTAVPKSFVLHLKSPTNVEPSSLIQQELFDLLQEYDRLYGLEVTAMQQCFIKQAPDVDVNPYGVKFREFYDMERRTLDTAYRAHSITLQAAQDQFATAKQRLLLQKAKHVIAARDQSAKLRAVPTPLPLTQLEIHRHMTAFDNNYFGTSNWPPYNC